MKVLCNATGAVCPQGWDICCGCCDELDTCTDKCGSSYVKRNPHACPDATAISANVVPFQDAVPDVIQNITNLIRMKQELDDQEKALKQRLVETMEAYGLKSFANDQIRLCLLYTSRCV